MRLILLLMILSIIACSDKKMNVKSMEIYDNKKDLMAMLDTVRIMDREPLLKRDSLGREFGWESEELKKQQELWDSMHVFTENKIVELLDNQGWPTEDLMDSVGNDIISIILQHSSLDIRLKYLPMMKEVVKRGQLEPSLLARAEDRIATDNGELQIYGGQMKYYPEIKGFNVWPVIDPANIDKRRSEIGLIPIAEHLKNRFDFEWDLGEQIKRSEAFEKERLSKPK